MANTEDYLDNLLDSITQARSEGSKRGAASEARSRRQERRSRIRPDDDFMEANGLNAYRRGRRSGRESRRRERFEDDFLRSFEADILDDGDEDFLFDFEREQGFGDGDFGEDAASNEKDDFDFVFSAPKEDEKPTAADNILSNIANIVSEAKRVASEDGDDTGDAIENALDAVDDEPDLSASDSQPFLDENGEGPDLMDMLSGEGDDDLSDIGDLLASDENEEELSEVRESYDEAAEGMAEGGEGLENAGSSEGGAEAKEAEAGEDGEEKKPNIVQKLLGAIGGIFKKKEGEEGESEDEEDDEEEEDEEEAEGEGGETKEEKKARLKKEKEEAKKKKKEEADAKKKAKEEEKKKKAEEKKKKAAEKKAKPKKKKKPKERSPKVPIPVIIVFLLFSFSIIGGTRIMTGVIGGMTTVSSAQRAYDEKNYLFAYQTLVGVGNLDKNGSRLRNKAKLMAYLDTKMEEYEICMSSGEKTDSGLDNYRIRTNYQMALDSLIEGAYFYRKNAKKADNLEINAEYDEYGTRFEQELNDTFTLTVGDAVDLYRNSTRKEYTAALQKIIRDAGFEDNY